MNWNLSSPLFNLFPIIFVVAICVHSLHAGFCTFLGVIEVNGCLVERTVLDNNIDVHFNYLSFFCTLIIAYSWRFVNSQFDFLKKIW